MTKTVTYADYKKQTKKEIKELGYEEVIIRIAWNVTKLMNKEGLK